MESQKSRSNKAFDKFIREQGRTREAPQLTHLQLARLAWDAGIAFADGLRRPTYKKDEDRPDYPGPGWVMGRRGWRQLGEYDG